MKVTIVKRPSNVVKLSDLQHKDTFRRSDPYGDNCDFLLIGHNAMLDVIHSSGKLVDGGARLMVYNINTGVIGSMRGTLDVVQTVAELTINA